MNFKNPFKLTEPFSFLKILSPEFYFLTFLILKKSKYTDLEVSARNPNFSFLWKLLITFFSALQWLFEELVCSEKPTQWQGRKKTWPVLSQQQNLQLSFACRLCPNGGDIWSIKNLPDISDSRIYLQHHLWMAYNWPGNNWGQVNSVPRLLLLIYHSDGQFIEVAQLF